MIADFCRKHGCPCAHDCPDGCELLAEAEYAENGFDIHSDDAHNDPRNGQAEELNKWR